MPVWRCLRRCAGSDYRAACGDWVVDERLAVEERLSRAPQLPGSFDPSLAGWAAAWEALGSAGVWGVLTIASVGGGGGGKTI